MLSLELIDAGLTLAQQRGDDAALLAEAPGVALLEETTTLTGQPAAQRVRVKPLQAQTNYWRALSTESLTRPSRLVRTTADVAFAQASELLGPHKSDGEGVLLAIPAGYTREQLGLLLGVINETGVNVAGVVDAALAACSLEPAPARALHLDLELHQALLTVLDYAGTKGGAGDRGGLKRNRYEIAPRHGLMALHQTWMQMIAENFVRNTRFDPLHDAASEQRLLDLLPEWLTALQENERITLALQFGERPLEIELERAQFVAAAEPHGRVGVPHTPRDVLAQELLEPGPDLDRQVVDELLVVDLPHVRRPRADRRRLLDDLHLLEGGLDLHDQRDLGWRIDGDVDPLLDHGFQPRRRRRHLE